MDRTILDLSCHDISKEFVAQIIVNISGADIILKFLVDNVELAVVKFWNFTSTSVQRERFVWSIFVLGHF